MQSPPKTFFQSFLRFIAPMAVAKKEYAVAVFLKLYESVLLLMSLNMLRLVTNYIAIGDSQSIIVFAWIYGIAVAIYAVIYRFGQDMENYIFLVPRYKIYRDILTKTLSMHPSYVEKIGTGKMMETIGGGLSWSILLMEVMHNGVGMLVMLLASLVSIMLIDSGYALVLACILLAFGFLYRIIQPKTTKLLKQRKEMRQRQSKFLAKFLMHRQEILTSGKAEEELGQLDLFLQGEKEIVSQRNRLNIRVFKLPDIVVYGVQIFIIVTFGLGAIAGNYSIGDFTMFVTILLTIQKIVMDILGLVRKVDFDIINVTKIWDIIDNAPMRDPFAGEEFVSDTGHVMMRHVHFGYEPDKKIFTDFDLVLPARSVTAFVGPSGGGKSTLIKLIAGVLNPDDGVVFVDNHDLSLIKIGQYYEYVGYLTQEPSVFDGTVRENLEYGIGDGRANLLDLPNNDIANTNGNGNAKSVSLQDVLEKSQCQFVYDLPNGLDTEIGERGVRLSGGQRQRLAIAKIMLKNPKIILLDEPTSALDSVSEELVSQAMQELFKDRTVVIIAHRLQTVKNADRILYIDRPSFDLTPDPSPTGEGSKIIEQGTHDELIALGGKYAKMVEVQTGF